MRSMRGAARAATRRVGGPRRRSTALLVPVPAAAGVVHLCTPRSAADHRSLPPHITVLHPFRPAAAVDGALLAELGRVIGAIAPFRFRLDRVERFPSGVVYLAPAPVEPFIALTTEVGRHWPEHPPYGGAFPTIVPHLTLVEQPVAVDLEQRIAPRLPVESDATEVALYGPDRHGRWRPLARFPLEGRAEPGST